MKFGTVVGLVGAAGVAVACCGVSAAGAAVRFVGQTNIVIWDAERHMEHFVRDARFATRGKDLGFIAPTPSEPTLSDADQAAFGLLASLGPRTAGAKSSLPVSKSAGAVEVIKQQDVAGYRATVLKAKDSKSLASWLKTNGYPTPKFLPGWVKPYTDRGWYLTAFKVMGSATGPVRMSFRTDRPFNPYSVPAENGGSGVPLMLYYVSAGNETPMIGGTQEWREPLWNAPIPAGSAVTLARLLKLAPNDIPSAATVTAYSDAQFGLPGFDDLYFVPSKGLGFGVWGSMLGLAGVVVGVSLWRMRSRRVPQMAA